MDTTPPQGQPILCRARRDSTRFRVRDLFASNHKVVGEIVDLSATGMRVFARGKCQVEKDQQLGFTLQWGQVSVPVRASVAWVRLIAAKEHLVGIHFETLNASETAAIEKLMTLADETLAVTRADARFAARRADK